MDTRHPDKFLRHRSVGGRNDVTITISGDTNRLTTDPVTGLQSPAITNSLQGGTSPVDSGLHIAADLHTNDRIIVTVTFSPAYFQGIEDVSFQLFDIDAETNEDRVSNINATPFGGGAPFASTISNLGSAVTVRSAGLNQVLPEWPPPQIRSELENGNATISFGTNIIQSFTFRFENTPGAPRLQQITLYNINFTPVPEINPAWSAVLSCIVATGWFFIMGSDSGSNDCYGNVRALARHDFLMRWSRRGISLAPPRALGGAGIFCLWSASQHI